MFQVGQQACFPRRPCRNIRTVLSTLLSPVGFESWCEIVEASLHQFSDQRPHLLSQHEYHTNTVLHRAKSLSYEQNYRTMAKRTKTMSPRKQLSRRLWPTWLWATMIWSLSFQMSFLACTSPCWKSRRCELRWNWIKQHLTPSRCFLFLQNYARTKPEIALHALPVLQQVRTIPVH